MKCREVMQLIEAYLDSELDAQTNIEMEKHLSDCAECARLVAAETQIQATLFDALRKGEATPGLWMQIEQAVRASHMVDSLATPTPQHGHNRSISLTRTTRLSEAHTRGWWSWLWPNPRFAAGLAVAWALILVLHFLSAEPSLARGSDARVAVPESSRALVEQRQALMELLGLAEMPVADPIPGVASPQSSVSKSSRDLECASFGRVSALPRCA